MTPTALIAPRSDSYGTLEASTSGVMLAITSCQRHHARLIAQGRCRANDKTRKKADDLGSKQANLIIDAWGSLAEICVYEALERLGQRLDYHLLSDRPVARPDLILNGVRLDVKACLPKNQYITVNCAAHQNPQKRPDCYLVCLFDSRDSLRVMCPVAHAEVSQWKMMTNGHSPYYSAHRNALRSLDSLNALLTIAKTPQVAVAT